MIHTLNMAADITAVLMQFLYKHADFLIRLLVSDGSALISEV